MECPSNWAAGEDVFIADEVTDKEATTEFDRGMAFIKPWLRITPMPASTASSTLVVTKEKEVENSMSVVEVVEEEKKVGDSS